MEKCKFSAERLSRYIDKQCLESETTAIDEHIKLCKNCQRELILLNAARLAVKSFNNVKVPKTLDKNIIDAIRNT